MIKTGATMATAKSIQVQIRGLHSKITHSDLLRTQGFIGGKWLDAVSKDHFVVADPSTCEDVARVAKMGREDAKLAIEAAVEAQRTWKKTTAMTRSNLLKKWHGAIRTHMDDLAMIASVESGKPYAEAKGEVAYAAGFIDFYAHECLRSSGFMIPMSLKGQTGMAVKEPVGVCGIITPWNFPLAMITRKLGPCLAAGCTAVIKPAAETPLSALALAKLAEEVGIPGGVINVVSSPHGHAADIGETLALSNEVRKLSFTGSTRVGKILMEQSAANVKRLSLELGGNAPFIVFEDADLPSAVDGLMQSKFRNTGQTCVSSNRVFVHSAVYEEFRDLFVARVKALKMGLPRDNGVQLGPLISATAFEKTASLVDDALTKGASVILGGKPSPVGKNYFEATILGDISSSMRVSDEEIFGPVVALMTFDSEEEVITRTNNTEMGLAGYFYTKDLARAWRVAGALECGMVGVNTGLVSNVQAPFGGVKQSGLGREGSHLGIEEYLETKLVVMGNLD